MEFEKHTILSAIQQWLLLTESQKPLSVGNSIIDALSNYNSIFIYFWFVVHNRTLSYDYHRLEFIVAALAQCVRTRLYTRWGVVGKVIMRIYSFRQIVFGEIAK